MTLKGAIDRLGTWAVTGITTNYGLDDVPGGAIPTDALPALLVDPGFSESGGGRFRPFDLAASYGKAVIDLDHLLLYTGVGLGRPQVRFYSVVALVDNYLSKVVDEWTLNDNLLEPLAIVEVSFGAIVWGGVVYYGVRFRHQWILKLT